MESNRNVISHEKQRRLQIFIISFVDEMFADFFLFISLFLSNICYCRTFFILCVFPPVRLISLVEVVVGTIATVKGLRDDGEVGRVIIHVYIFPSSGSCIKMPSSCVYCDLETLKALKGN